MTLAVDGDALADIVVSAISSLTHQGAVKKAGTSGGYTLLTMDSPPPDNAHASCFMLVYRTVISGYTCKIKVSPGLQVGTNIDPASTDLENLTVGGGGLTQAKNSLAANNTVAHAGLSRKTQAKGLRKRGSNAKIVWQPFPAETRNWVGNKATPQTVPAWLVLAHELSHADRIMRGTSLTGVVGGLALQKYDASAPGTTYTSMVDPEHIEMVGFQCPNWTCKDPDVITENAMRAEHNMPLRCNY